MRRRVSLASLAGLIVGVSLSLAADLNMGVWKLNAAKSKFGDASMSFSERPDGVNVTVRKCI